MAMRDRQLMIKMSQSVKKHCNFLSVCHSDIGCNHQQVKAKVTKQEKQPLLYSSFHGTKGKENWVQRVIREMQRASSGCNFNSMQEIMIALEEELPVCVTPQDRYPPTVEMKSQWLLYTNLLCGRWPLKTSLTLATNSHSSSDYPDIQWQVFQNKIDKEIATGNKTFQYYSLF